MTITVKLFATLRGYNEKILSLSIEDGTKIIDVVRMIHVPEEEVAIIMVNGRGVVLEAELKDGDVLALFPAVGGG